MVKTYEALRRSYSESATAARMRVWWLLMGFAYDTGGIAENPAKILRIKSARPRRQTWTPEQVDILCAHCEKPRARGRKPFEIHGDFDSEPK